MSSFFPLNRKSTPPAFPALTMISFRPRAARSLPAANNADDTVSPSAVIEIQESSCAWITTVNSPGVAAVAAGAKSWDVWGATDGGDAAVVEPAMDELAVGEACVGEAGVGAAEGGEAAPDDGSAGNGAADVVGFGGTDGLGYSRWRRLQRESASATRSRTAANAPHGNCRAGARPALASRRLRLSSSLRALSSSCHPSSLSSSSTRSPWPSPEP